MTIQEDENLPAPLCGTHIDLDGMEHMPLMISRLRNSSFWLRSSDKVKVVHLELLMSAWAQRPAASLPDSDLELAQLAGMGRDAKAFRKIRTEVLDGFIKCSDGRWYNPLLADRAQKAWKARLDARARQQRRRSTAGAQAEDEPAPSCGTGSRDAEQMSRVTSRGDDEEHHATVTEQGKVKVEVEGGVGREERSPPEVGRRQPQAQRLPPDWTPGAEGREFAIKHGLRPELVFAKFQAYWLGESGPKARKVDWQAAWRFWCLREAGDARGRPRSGRIGNTDEDILRAAGLSHLIDGAADDEAGVVVQ